MRVEVDGETFDVPERIGTIPVDRFKEMAGVPAKRDIFIQRADGREVVVKGHVTPGDGDVFGSIASYTPGQ